EPSLADTTSDVPTGAPSANAVTERAPGSTTRPGAASTSKDTVSTAETAPSAVAVRRPVCVPPARPAGSTRTSTVPGRDTVGDVTESHGASLVREATVPASVAVRARVRTSGPSAASTTRDSGSQTRALEPLS